MPAPAAKIRLGLIRKLAHRFGHGFEVIGHGLGQGLDLRQHQQRVLHVGVGGQFPQPEQIGLAVLAQLGRPVGQRGLRIGRVRRRRLQHRQIQLEAVVGQQGGGDPGRQQQRILAHRGNGFVFFHGVAPTPKAELALLACQAYFSPAPSRTAAAQAMWCRPAST